jgi:hypothetical protein
MSDDPKPWADTNAIWRSMKSFRTRIAEVLRRPVKPKIVYGPAGTAGTSTFIRKLQAPTITGKISFPILYRTVYRASRPGEVLFVDDVACLSDRRIQSAMQQASEPAHDGAVRRAPR